MPRDKSAQGGPQARVRSQLWSGYPLDGAVLVTGCEKTTPACLMAAGTVNTPVIVLPGGPMLNHVQDGKLRGSGTVIGQERQDQESGKIGYKEFIDIVAASAPS